jgi:5-methylcytosine-specific restriction protein A
VKLCTVCGVVTSRAGSRCLEHARQSNRSRHNALYSTRPWQRLSARVLRAWRGEHGNWCPGYQRDAHPAGDLTVDHVMPLAAGGAPFDIGNCAVLCRSCNSTKGSSEADRGHPHAGFALLKDRAFRSCAHGRVSLFFIQPISTPAALRSTVATIAWASAGTARMPMNRRHYL